MQVKVFDRATDHFIVSGNVTQAVELIMRESVNIGPFEALEQIRLWFKLLPDDVVNNNPVLLYIKSYIFMRGEADALILLKKALLKFRETNDVIMQLKTLFSIVHFYAYRNYAENIISTLDQVQALFQSADNPEFEGIIAVTDLQKAFWEERFSRGVDLSRRANSYELVDDWKWLALVYSCQLHYLLGELDTAESFIKEAFEMELIKKAEMIKGFALLFFAVVLQLKNDRTVFSAVKDKLMAIGEKYNFQLILGYGKRLLALESYYVHDPETALELLKSSTEHFERLENHAMDSLNKLTRCLWLSRQRNPEELLEDAKQAYSVLSSTRPGFCLLEIGQSILGAVAREAGDYDFAEQVLLASIKKSRSTKAKQILCGSCLHLAKVYYDTGDRVKGEETLRQAFYIASTNGYFMLWDLHLPTLVEMSAQCVMSGIYSEYAIELIDRYYGKEAAEFFRDNAIAAEDSTMGDFCREFTSLYGVKSDPVSPRMNAGLFGKFNIKVNGVLIPQSEWKTRKIEGILKYLILHRGRIVTREHLMELFWPVADKKSASMSLRAALYELRKVLKRHGIPPEGNSAFIQEKSGCLIVPGGSTLLVDTEMFLSLYDELKQLPDSEYGKVKRTKLLERMVSIYKGNILEDEIYEDWTFFEREEFKSKFLESVLSLNSIYMDRQEHEKAEKLLLKTLALDPNNEEACLCLLNLYISTNQRTRAIKLYANFEKRLKEELDLEPDEKLSSVAKKLAPKK
ncbi:MAG: BTAD domain-containing putative transcriptional regulator [Bacillota bacterium]